MGRHVDDDESDSDYDANSASGGLLLLPLLLVVLPPPRCGAGRRCRLCQCPPLACHPCLVSVRAPPRRARAARAPATFVWCATGAARVPSPPDCIRAGLLPRVRADSEGELPAGVGDDPFFQREDNPFNDPFFQVGGWVGRRVGGRT